MQIEMYKTDIPSFDFNQEELTQFLLTLINKGLELNKKYYPEDFVNKDRGHCFMTYHNNFESRFLTIPFYYSENGKSMPEKFILASLKKWEVLLSNQLLIETRSVQDREKNIHPGGAKRLRTIFCLSGLHPNIDEACDIVACIWETKYQNFNMKKYIFDTWKDDDICKIAFELYEYMKEKMSW